jgi:hypothetical protein
MNGITRQCRIMLGALYTVLLLSGLGAAAQSTGAGSTQPVFSVTSYGASASASIGECSAITGSNVLTGCVLTSFDFQPGEGIHIIGGGPAPATAAVTAAPVITEEGGGTGSHTYCYVVSTADPLEGISAPSPQACVSNLPALSFPAAWNLLGVVNSSVGPSPSFLYYVSEDGAPFQLVTVAGYGASAMDVGQRPGSRGGWPENLPAANPNIAKNEDLYTTVSAVSANQITTAAVLPVSLTNAIVLHDDTAAVQAAINAAVAAGGGTVQFTQGSFFLERPSFQGTTTMANPPYTTALAADPYYSTYSYLQIPNTSTGNISIQGMGNTGTAITTAPDHGDMAMLIAAGFRPRPDDLVGVLKMQNVAKGATTVSLASAPTGISAGTDIWLYSGSFTGSTCQDLNGTANECHFSELNTVTAVSGNTLILRYPTSKRYFNDGTDSFGLVVMPTVPHNLALSSMLINTYNPIFTTGMVYGLTVNAVEILGFVTHGPFGGGFKRDVTIENSGWGFGTGDASYGATDEYDQFTNVSFINNEMVGYGAPGAEWDSLMPRLYATEGSSGFTYKNNVMYNASIYFDQTTDDVITGNQMQNGIIKVGTAFGNNQFQSGPAQDPTFDSYNSQEAADVDTNTITITAGFLAPFLLQFGHFTSATVTENTFTDSGSSDLAAITAYSGTFTGNTISMTGQGVNIPFALIPDQSPMVSAAPFNVVGNSLGASGISIGVYINNPGFTDTAPICLENDTLTQNFDVALLNSEPSSVTLSCP